MTSASIKLYDILVTKGVERDLAREAVAEFLTKEEATARLATKEDITRLVMWMAGFATAQTATIVAIIALFF